MNEGQGVVVPISQDVAKIGFVLRGEEEKEHYGEVSVCSAGSFGRQDKYLSSGRLDAGILAAVDGTKAVEFAAKRRRRVKDESSSERCGFGGDQWISAPSSDCGMGSAGKRTREHADWRNRQQPADWQPGNRAGQQERKRNRNHRDRNQFATDDYKFAVVGDGADDDGCLAEPADGAGTGEAQKPGPAEEIGGGYGAAGGAGERVEVAGGQVEQGHA